MIYANCENISIPGNNGKQNPDGSYRNKDENRCGYSYGYKVVFVDDQFSKLFKSCLGQDALHKFISSIAKES